MVLSRPMDPVRIAQELVRELKPLRFKPPVSHVYNPLVYAWKAHRRYLELYGKGPKAALLVGMNPGPWGMAQTGVPFGEVRAVRDWLGLQAPVGQPERLHPKRPVHGFACLRSEVSGARLWGWARDNFASPEEFFSRFFVWNYCPLLFIDKDGGNRTPDKLPASERRALEAVCDRALLRLATHLKPRTVIGIGNFAQKKAQAALRGLGLVIGRIPHPSPANPGANRDWAGKVQGELKRLGLTP